MWDKEEYIRKYNEQGFNTKEDLIFEVLLYILNNQLYRRGIENVHDVEEAYRIAYQKLPYFYELDKMENIKKMNDKEIIRLREILPDTKKIKKEEEKE